MRSFVLFLLVLCLATPAFADDPAPTPTATATPAPTLEPRCEDAGPLVRCRAVQDPAAVLNQRVTAVEQGLAQLRQQAAQALQEQAKRIDALTPKKAAK